MNRFTAVPLAAATCVAAYHLAKWWFSPTWGAEVVAEIDADPDVNTQDGATSNIARRVAYEFKAEFGELKYTKANRCIAGDWVRKRFREMDMRYVDIAIHMDMCVELCLLPTKHAVRAAALARTHEVRDRRSVVDFAK